MNKKTILVKVLKIQNDNLGRAKICDKKHYVLLENLNEDKDFKEVISSVAFLRKQFNLKQDYFKFVFILQLEIGGVVKCMFTYYGIKSFKCELLSTELFDEIPGECHVTESQKRNLSDSSSITSINNNPRRRLKGIADDIPESMSQFNINSINEVSPEEP